MQVRIRQSSSSDASMWKVKQRPRTKPSTTQWICSRAANTIGNCRGVPIHRIHGKKEKELKHDGYLYRFSPYDLVWNNDCYYIFGWSQKHDKIVKFRVDRMHQPKLSAVAYHPLTGGLRHQRLLRASLYDVRRQTVQGETLVR